VFNSFILHSRGFPAFLLAFLNYVDCRSFCVFPISFSRFVAQVSLTRLSHPFFFVNSIIKKSLQTEFFYDIVVVAAS